MSLIYLEWHECKLYLRWHPQDHLENVIWDTLTYIEYRGKIVTTMDVLYRQEGVVVLGF